MKRTILLALVLACGAAQASEWVSVKGTSTNSTEVFVDVSSVHESEDITRAWVKVVYARHTQRGTGADSKKWADHAVSRNAYNCGEGNAEIEAATVYFEDGTYREAPSWTLGTEEPVPPDTVGDALMKFVCAWKPPLQNSDAHLSDEPHLSDAGKLATAQPIKTIRMPNCGEDYYPAQALRLNQQGSVIVRFCIGVNNKIDGPVEVVRSSGFPLLDEAAGKCVGAGSYKAAIVNGVPARTCKEVSLHFAPLEGR